LLSVIGASSRKKTARARDDLAPAGIHIVPR
jgi:hypothetical protein